jgi:hypothetical protein
VPQPRLIHPVPVMVEQFSPSTTRYDEQAREAVQQAARKPVKTVPGQPRWSMGEALETSLLGATIDARGYVLFRRVDLEAQSLVLVVNDRIIRIANEVVDLYIVRLQPLGHYETGWTLVRAYFADRRPSKEKPAL